MASASPIDSTGKLKAVADLIDSTHLAKRAGLTSHAHSLIVHIIEDGNTAMQETDIVEFQEVLKLTVPAQLADTSIFQYTLAKAAAVTYSTYKLFTEKKPLREALAELGVDTIPALKVAPQDYMKDPKLSSLAQVCAYLTCTQALVRAVGPGETREQLAGKCMRGFKLQGMAASPSLAQLLNEAPATKSESQARGSGAGSRDVPLRHPKGLLRSAPLVVTRTRSRTVASLTS